MRLTGTTGLERGELGVHAVEDRMVMHLDVDAALPRHLGEMRHRGKVAAERGTSWRPGSRIAPPKSAAMWVTAPSLTGNTKPSEPGVWPGMAMLG